jgi:hypothetical protein
VTTGCPPWSSGWSSSGVPLQALVQNDGEHPDLAQGTPVHAYLPPDALRVLAGARGVVPAPAEEPLVAT